MTKQEILEILRNVDHYMVDPNYFNKVKADNLLVGLRASIAQIECWNYEDYYKDYLKGEQSER